MTTTLTLPELLQRGYAPREAVQMTRYRDVYALSSALNLTRQEASRLLFLSWRLAERGRGDGR